MRQLGFPMSKKTQSLLYGFFTAKKLHAIGPLLAIFERMNVFGKRDKLQIIAFQAYGTDTHFYARGRALEDEEIDLAQKGFFPLIWNFFKRFETDEIKHTPLVLRLADGREFQTTTDVNGYYKFEQNEKGLMALVDDYGWLSYEISYADTQLNRPILNQNRFPGELLIPASTADFGVISDIDDTILHTGVVSNLKWRVIVNTIFKRASKRKAMEGAADFYKALHRGPSGSNTNPIFYVSHSPWNLYRYLKFFLANNNFPKGPILLRSFSDFRILKSSHEKPQKQKEILNILQTYPDLKFILIGDCGEYDADIYIEIANDYPRAIAAIYLRSVNHHKKMLRIQQVIKSHSRTPILIVENSEQAFAHAREKGFIAV